MKWPWIQAFTTCYVPVSHKRRMLTAATAVTAIFLVTWFMLWLFTADHFWWMAMLNRAVPYLFVPALVLGVLALIGRSLRLAVLAALPLLLFAWLYWPYLGPRRASSEGAEVLRVMTYNVLFSNNDADGIAGVIHAYTPDLVALQEVQPGMMAALQKRLTNNYPYALMGTRHDYGTTAVFSRYPLIDQEIIELGDDRPATLVTIEKGDMLITFTAVHLRAYGLRWVPLGQMPEAIAERTYQQNQQAKTLLDALSGRHGTIIIGCDCNSQETSSSYRILQEKLLNAAWGHARTPPPGTQPDTRLTHIDYILYRGHLKASGAFVIKNTGGSDHHPLLAVFTSSGH